VQSERKRIIAWSPKGNPAQEALLACPIEDIFFGGARGGGKSFGIIGKWLQHVSMYRQHAQGVVFRRTYRELEQFQKQCRSVLPLLGWYWRAGDKEWVHPCGASLKLRYLRRDADAANYQGHEYTFMAFDEVTNWASPDPIDMLRACLRNGAAMIQKVFICSGNPGGIGHGWVKSRYVDPAPAFRAFQSLASEDFPELGSIWRIFIPSLLENNKALLENDPDYAKRIAASGPRHLVKAWLYGMWDIVAGGMFDDVFDKRINVIAPFRVPSSWYVDRSFDWGSSSPFAVLWWAKSDGTPAPNGVHYPKGTLFLIREWYGWNGKINEGLRMTARDIAKGIHAREKYITKKVRPGPADTQIYQTVNGMCIAKDMEAEGIRWELADKSPGSRIGGWELMRQLFKNVADNPGEYPGLYFFDHCTQALRTIPTLTRDEKVLDDIADGSEDHIADAARYRILQPSSEWSSQPLRM
jgi:hypothetical protein